jgi:hypothetical protein
MQKLSYRRHRFHPDIIQQAVWLYFRFTMSYRDVEVLLAERGIDVTYETVRLWGWCQSNANRSPNYPGAPGSCGDFPPPRHRRVAVLLEVVAGSQVSVEVEVVLDGSVNSGEFLQGLDVPEICHRSFASPERLV